MEEPKILLKPVFVNRNDRETLVERNKIEEEIEDVREFEKKKKEDKKNLTKLLVAETIRKEQEGIKDHEAVDAYDSDANLPFTDDDDEDNDYVNSE